MIEKSFADHYNQKYLFEILACKDVRSSTALFAYANYLNKKKARFDYNPLYMEIFRTNNKYAIDAMLNGYVARRFFDFIKVPDLYLLKTVFQLLAYYKSNGMYEKTTRVFCGLLKRVYRSGGQGFRMYPLSIADVNNLGKYLDESKDQDYDINRDILDILSFLSDLDQHYEFDTKKKEIARQAASIRSDFFDNKRSLTQSLTTVTLEKALKVDAGIAPEGFYRD